MKKHTILALAATLFTLVASFVASSACWWGWYQPKEPTILKDK